MAEKNNSGITDPEAGRKDWREELAEAKAAKADARQTVGTETTEKPKRRGRRQNLTVISVQEVVRDFDWPNVYAATVVNLSDFKYNKNAAMWQAHVKAGRYTVKISVTGSAEKMHFNLTAKRLIAFASELAYLQKGDTVYFDVKEFAGYCGWSFETEQDIKNVRHWLMEAARYCKRMDIECENVKEWIITGTVETLRLEKKGTGASMDLNREFAAKMRDYKGAGNTDRGSYGLTERRWNMYRILQFEYDRCAQNGQLDKDGFMYRSFEHVAYEVMGLKTYQSIMEGDRAVSQHLIRPFWENLEDISEHVTSMVFYVINGDNRRVKDAEAMAEYTPAMLNMCRVKLVFSGARPYVPKDQRDLAKDVKKDLKEELKKELHEELQEEILDSGDYIARRIVNDLKKKGW